MRFSPWVTVLDTSANGQIIISYWSQNSFIARSCTCCCCCCCSCCCHHCHHGHHPPPPPNHNHNHYLFCVELTTEVWIYISFLQNNLKICHLFQVYNCTLLNNTSRIISWYVHETPPYKVSRTWLQWFMTAIRPKPKKSLCDCHVIAYHITTNNYHKTVYDTSF